MIKVTTQERSHHGWIGHCYDSIDVVDKDGNDEEDDDDDKFLSF